MIRSRRVRVGLVLLCVPVAAWLTATAIGGDPFSVGGPILAPPSAGHLLGTDQLGRDVLDRALHGAGTSLLVAVFAVAPATLVGTLLGLCAGYVGGVADDVLLKLIELFQVVPHFLLAIVVAATFGASLPLLVAVLAATFWTSTARLARAEALAIKQREFVTAALALGAGDTRLLSRHLLPVAAPPLVVNASFQAGTAVLVEAGLAFLGLGDRSVVSWGSMLADAQAYVAVAWWTSLFPGLAVAITVIGMNLLGDGLNQAWDRL